MLPLGENVFPDESTNLKPRIIIIISLKPNQPGIRNSIINDNRFSITTCEGVTAYETPWSESAKGSGSHHLMRTKVNSYTRGENDDCVAGTGEVHVGQYAFQHKVAAPPAAVEYIMRPAPHGFQKRFHVIYSPPQPLTDDDHNCASADSLLKRFHEFMFAEAMNTPQGVVYPDQCARTMYKACKQAVTEFVLSKACAVHENTKAKLGFFDSDLLRYANVRRRWALFLQRNSGANVPGQSRDGFNVYELCSAMHVWIRQVKIHHAYYRYWSAVTTAVPERGLKEVLEKKKQDKQTEPTPRLHCQLNCRTHECPYYSRADIRNLYETNNASQTKLNITPTGSKSHHQRAEDRRCVLI